MLHSRSTKGTRRRIRASCEPVRLSIIIIIFYLFTLGSIIIIIIIIVIIIVEFTCNNFVRLCVIVFVLDPV